MLQQKVLFINEHNSWNDLYEIFFLLDHFLFFALNSSILLLHSFFQMERKSDAVIEYCQAVRGGEVWLTL